MQKTQNKDTSVNAIYLAGETETTLPTAVRIKGIKPAKKATIQLLGVKKSLKWKMENGEIVVIIPASLQKTPPCNYAWLFKISHVE